MMRLCNVTEFDPEEIRSYPVLKKPKGNPGGRKKSITYLDCVCAFDIETTTATINGKEINFMYIWQFQIDTDVTVYGRTWSEFKEFLSQIRERISGEMLVVYDHNLSYEFQYIKSIFTFGQDDVFATDSRKVVKCIIDQTFELRDSYILTNMSLDAFTRKMNVEHQKLSGIEFNYDRIRYPWTKLSQHELEYCINDVRGLVEAVKAQMARDGDNLYTIPMTSTGYPRREMKRAMRLYSRQALRDMQPNYSEYQLLRDCFRGGNTHANRYYSGKIVDSEMIHARILSSDRSSSYPDVLMNCRFPMNRWKRGEASIENLKNLIENGYAVMFRAEFTDLRLKNEHWPVPYLSTDKCQAAAVLVDNGRIISAAICQTALTDVDFRILLYEYQFSDMSISELYFTEYDYLPKPMRAVISEYYRQKTSLKGDTDPFNKLLYDKSKAVLNGLYGMMAQDPVKQDIIWTGSEFIEAEDDPEEKLLKHNRNAFINYAWGVWCTAWARYRLEQGIIIAGPEDFIYCDTDSVKYVDHGQSWEKFNDQARAASEASGACAHDSKQNLHYMGVYEPDGEYLRFSTLGSKRYAYEDMSGDLHITISGVSKKAAAELGKLENFKEGFIFYHPGKTEADYVDFPESDRLVVDDKLIEITSYVIIRETTYNLSISESYKNLLRLIESDMSNY